jgi:hypothetical protein
MEDVLILSDRRPYNNLARQAMVEGAELEEMAEDQWNRGRHGDMQLAAAYATLATMKYTKAAAIRALRPV